MKSPFGRATFLLSATLASSFLLPPAFAQRWSVQYFYDEDRSALVLEDLAFPSAQHGFAAGTIYEKPAVDRKPKFAILVTGDGGEHWSVKPVGEHPRSLFFLDDKTGWMVTDESIWSTADSGQTWKKTGEQKKPDRKLHPTPAGGLILRVWFLDAQHGFGVGLQKTVVETHDGGHTWAPVEEADKPSANPAFTAYTRISFDAPRGGFIIGGASPPRPDDENQLPPWLEPEKAVKRTQVPNLTLLLQTTDGGATWHSSTAPLFGVATSVRLAGHDGLVVLGFNESFEWPAEVHHFELSTGQTTLAYRDKNLRVIDGAMFAGPTAFLGGVEPGGKLNSAAIPSKIRMLTSTNLTDWTEMKVDYKAVARSLIMSGPDAGHLWAATDTGMILHLVP